MARGWVIFTESRLDYFGVVGPTPRAEIAQEPDFTSSFRLAYRDEINPAVIVVVNCRNSPAALPAEIGERNAFEMFAIDVAPQADAGSADVSESEIHPAIFIEIKRDDAHSGRKIFFFEVDSSGRREFSLARIEKNRRAVTAAGDHEIDGAVVVEIRGHEACAGGVEAESGFGGDVGKRAVTVVAPENVVRCRFPDVAAAVGCMVM